MEIALIIALFIIILIYSIILHEIAHGVVALWLGDSTAKDAGRITLDPVPHIDFFGSIVVPVLTILATPFAFGWAKPVPYNPLALMWQKWGPVLVALGGPLTNFLLATCAAIGGAVIPIVASEKSAIITALFQRDFLNGDLAELIVGDYYAIFFAMCAMAVFWNVVLGIFNLFPIPPLDGSKVMYALFDIPEKVKIFLEQHGMILLFLFIIISSATGLNIIGAVVLPVMNFFMNLML